MMIISSQYRVCPWRTALLAFVRDFSEVGAAAPGACRRASDVGHIPTDWKVPGKTGYDRSAQNGTNTRALF